MDTIRAIIFDLDGVICFTDNYHYQAWKELADAEGIYFDEKINGRLRGVSRTLDTLRQRGYKLAIGSSSKNTKKILKQIGLDGYFDAVSDGTNITKSKPDPEVFIKAAEMVEEKPENCLVVEDALAGIDAAYAGGFISAGIGDAASHKYVTYPIHTFSDLLSIDKL